MASTTVRKLSSLLKKTAKASMAHHAPQSRDRRAQPRFTAQFRSTFSGRHEEGQGRTLDISSIGCKIESGMAVAQGTRFECRIHIPGLDWPLRIDEANVRWVSGNTFGIEFTRMRPEEAAKLDSVLADLQRGE